MLTMVSAKVSAEMAKVAGQFPKIAAAVEAESRLETGRVFGDLPRITEKDEVAR